MNETVEMTMESNEQQRKIHPHKFTLWVAMGSILMMFAGFTSAYIVKRNQANWQGFDLPAIFTYSTAIIIASSITIHLSLVNFRKRNMIAYRRLLFLSGLLGVIFVITQYKGFVLLQTGGIKMIGSGSNVAASFLGAIAGMHMLHVLGGVVAILIMLFKTLRKNTRSYNIVPVEIIASYWHFVDALWIYLFIFLNTVT
jgi:cytochrome c oxidase subunit 3